MVGKNCHIAMMKIPIAMAGMASRRREIFIPELCQRYRALRVQPFERCSEVDWRDTHSPSDIEIFHIWFYLARVHITVNIQLCRLGQTEMVVVIEQKADIASGIPAGGQPEGEQILPARECQLHKLAGAAIVLPGEYRYWYGRIR